jgi:hypothetical protein
MVHMDSSRGLDTMNHPAPSVDPSTPARARIPTAGLVVLGAIVALIGVAVVLVLADPKGPTSYEPGSPEAAFQSFVQAGEAGDPEGAHALFSSSIKAEVTLAEYRRVSAEHEWQRDESRRVVLLGTDVTGDRASLHLRIDQFNGGGLGAARTSYERTIRLIRERGAWLIDEPIVGVEYVSYGF